MEHLPRDGGYIIAANHASHLDGPAAIAAQQIHLKRVHSLAAQDYFFDHPVKAWFCQYGLNMIPFRRRGSFHDCLPICQQLLAKQDILLVFPEGTRSPSGSLQPFKLGLGMLAIQLNARIVPAYIQGTYQALPKGTRIPHRYPIQVRFGPPIVPSTYEHQKSQLDARQLYREIVADVSSAIAALRDRSEGEYRQCMRVSMTEAKQDVLWGHKWGFADTYFEIGDDRTVTMRGQRYPLAGYKMPHLLPYIESLLDIQLDPSDCPQEHQDVYVPAVTPHPAFYEAIASTFPANQYSFDDGDRLLHSHGQTTFEEVYKVLHRRLERVADMVFFCTSTEDAELIINLAMEHDICLVPFGGGTSVSCALTLPPEESRPIVSVDMRQMNRVEWVDTDNLRAGVQAGMTGAQLEAFLKARGYTCGHEPDSLELSTLGGWIATNASGMKKNRYGNIEDIVENITLVTPFGKVEQVAATTRAAMGMQLQALLFGNEGNLGIVTRATIKIHPLPAKTQYGSLLFPNFNLGVEFLYELAHSGCIPASIRLVDNNQFRFGQALKPAPTGWTAIADRLKKHYVLNAKGFEPTQMVAATVVMEGSDAEVNYQNRFISQLAKQYGGLATGAENGRRGYMLTYAIAYLRDFLASHHIIGETFETSAPWSQIHPICAAVQKTLEDNHRQFNLPGKPYLSYRISQIYHSGVCIYFMFGFYTKGVRDPDVMGSTIEHNLRRSIIENGGSISHHHGVGKIRRAFMSDTLSEASIDLLKQVKQAIDPQNIFGIRNTIY